MQTLHPLDGPHVRHPTVEQRKLHWLSRREEKFLKEINAHGGAIVREVRDNLVRLFGAKRIRLTAPGGILTYEPVNTGSTR